MSNENLHPKLVAWLTKRQRWLRTGGDNVIKYLSHMLDCGPNRLEDIRDVLNAAEAPLYVELDERGVIRKVGLVDWLDDTSIETEEVSEDLREAWSRIIEQEGAIERLRMQLRDEDELITHALAADERADVLAAQLAELQARPAQPASETVQAYEEKIEALQRRLDNANSALNSVRTTLATKTAEVEGLEHELRTVRNQLATAEADNERYKELLPMLDSETGRELLQALPRMFAQHGKGMAIAAFVA